MLYTGEVEEPLDEDSVRRALSHFKEEGADSVAVCLMWSMINPAHERRIEALLTEEMPDAYTALSADILPRIREYPRACATVLSAYVGPAIEDYLTKIAEFFRGQRLSERPLALCRSPADRHACPRSRSGRYSQVGSGPAAGPPASLFIGYRHGERNQMLIEMGGTSFEVSMITGGEIPMSTDMEIAGFPLGVAAVDIHSIGAGGGEYGVDRPWRHVARRPRKAPAPRQGPPVMATAARRRPSPTRT